MDKSTTASKNTALDAALAALGQVTRAVDLRWLAEAIQARQQPGYRARLHGIPGGHEQYPREPALERAVERMTRLSPPDLATLALVVEMLYRLLEPQSASTGGTVQLKTFTRYYPVIDWQATAENNGLTVYVLDDNGEPVKQPFAYTYAYVRVYAGKADADRQGRQLLSLYADRGMGKGGTGGYAAAALNEGLIEPTEVLAAWHAGEAAYQVFLDQCAELLHANQDNESGKD